MNHPFLEGTPDLRPENVRTLDIQWIYQGSRTQTSVNYFSVNRTDSIVVGATPDRGKFMNLGEVAFHGAELEQKYYFKQDFFLTGSVLYQSNRDGNGLSNGNSIANFGAKAGLSCRSESGRPRASSTSIRATSPKRSQR